jgi:ABC-type nitrate/sulfonate/bicarbonate transport system substrate-binding protein
MKVAVQRGAGTVVLDIRRSDGPPACFNYTMASIAATDRLINDRPDDAAGAIRAITAAHAALKSDPPLAGKVGEKLFPPQEARLIENLIRRDLPYYDASISPDFVDGMNAFARDLGSSRATRPTRT